MNKFAIILATSAFAFSANLLAGDAANLNEMAATKVSNVVYGDPDGTGIGYEWTVRMPRHGSVEILGSVGGKSSFEPQFQAPDFGWTHTSDWVAVELAADAVLEIKVSRQGGFYEMKVDDTDNSQSYVTAGAELYPALSVYTGWDSTTEKEKGSFNPGGNFWSTLEFKAVEYSKLGETTITYRAKLPAGQYSVNIGGVNAIYCAETDACYNGLHGYRAKFTTSHMHGEKPAGEKPAEPGKHAGHTPATTPATTPK
ncbi:MAG: hypothetical protein Q9M50_13305 [Methylococcales bacterium]|nr:hypothetical protein [Methylococcales bacterium]